MWIKTLKHYLIHQIDFHQQYWLNIIYITSFQQTPADKNSCAREKHIQDSKSNWEVSKVRSWQDKLSINV